MLDKARDANMTKDSVTRAIQRGTGELEGVSYEEARYEGYGPGGAAVMVDCLTDNRTRTIAEVRHAFTKDGRQHRRRRLGGVPVQALRPVRVRARRERGQAHGGGAGRGRRRRRDATPTARSR